MQREEEYRAQFHASHGCCRFLYYKKFTFVLVCVLLLIVLASVTVALYYGISVKEFSGLLIGLGIWLPSIILGMICVYIALIGTQRSTIATPPCGSSELNSQSNPVTGLNLRVRYQPEILLESPEVPVEVRPEKSKHQSFKGCKDLPNDPPNKLERSRKHFRSLSSSKLNRYESKLNREENGHNREKVEHGGRTSGSKTQREQLLNPRLRRFRRSLSETGMLKYGHVKFAENTSKDNGLIHYPETYEERKHFSLMEELSNCKFYNEIVEEPPRDQVNFGKYPFGKNGHFVEQKYDINDLHVAETYDNFLQYHPDSKQSTDVFQNHNPKTLCKEEDKHLDPFPVYCQEIGGILNNSSKKLCTEENGYKNRISTNSLKSETRIQKYPLKNPCATGSEHLLQFQTDSSKNMGGIKQYSMK